MTKIQSGLEEGTLEVGMEEWPCFLCEDFGSTYDPNDPVAHIFKSTLLLQVYPSIYCGTKTRMTGATEQSKCKLKGTAANLQSVSGRTITYIATHIYPLVVILSEKEEKMMFKVSIGRLYPSLRTKSWRARLL
ncbi:hypothetical protein M422DRAFT_51636 [Sphaerobolus stellatus SS14]|uniref:Uncharacterized protein n=1 Tax=Sphaerobolus stellatus (strain SS14) TaxID=990650 RepID=A0A0C9TXD5_SPHS4|nr:hypothetical protein M422DRAFT_51636 [Sphaerobolus stellatus SS14]